MEFEIFNANNLATTIRSYQLHSHEMTVRQGLDIWFSTKPGSLYRTLPHLRRFGDREVLCMESDDGIQFWIFNLKFTPDIPGAEPSYRWKRAGEWTKHWPIQMIITSGISTRDPGSHTG